MSKTISEPAGLPDSKEPAPAKFNSKFFRRLAGNRLIVAIGVFLIAFGLRAGHNLSLEHRVWYFEDAQNYLRSGASIYRMINDSKSPSQFFENVKSDAKGYSGIYQAFTSDKLVDRLLTDGAIFPIYLAGVEAVAGLETKNPQYEKIALKASLANSLLDSLAAVLIFLLGALLFGFLPGVLAAGLYAFYPPAIINTQWCMSETFCSFMLVATVYSLARLLMLPPSLVAHRSLAAAVTGVAAGLTILARSAFPFFVPFLGIAAVFGTRSGKALRSPWPLVALATTFLLTLTPWCLYTQTALGQARLTTNRLPAYNVVSGNLASIDGYTPFPSKVAFPEGMKEALTMVFDEARERPVEFTLLEMKKVARLWSSVWNDCKYSVLGIDASTQTVFHQLMLFLALCWGFIAVARGKRQLTDGELLGTWLTFAVIVAHFIYLAFIALSRYAITAMPFVILAASAAVVYWLRAGQLARKKLALVVAAFILVSATTNQFRSFSQFLCALVPESWWLMFAPWLTTAMAIGLYAGVWFLAVRAISRFTFGQIIATETTSTAKPARGPISATTGATNNTALENSSGVSPGSNQSATGSQSQHSERPGSSESGSKTDSASENKSEKSSTSSTPLAADTQRLALVLLAAVSFAITNCGIIGSIIGSRTWSEWSCSLTNQEAHQTVQLPATLGAVSKTGFVLIDLHDEEPLPQVEVELNNQVLNADAIPIEMIQTDNDSITGSLIMQANSMNMDYRALRHWYAVPFSTDLLRVGEQNTLAVRNKSKTHPLTIYGDYSPTTKGADDGVQVLPSINSQSWNYAVEGSDYHSPMEPRLLDPVALNGKTTESSLISKIRSRETYRDLSPSFGTQWGRYRLRLLLQPRTAQQLAKQTTPDTSLPSEKLSESRQSERQISATTREGDKVIDPNSQIATIFAQKANQELVVHGGNPQTFCLSNQPIPVSEALVAKHPFKFTCELKTEKRPVNAFVNLVFKTGIGDVWTPEWQPECIPVDNDRWKKLTIIDSFPKKLLEHNGLSVQPIITPFGKDLLFTQRRKAGKQVVLVRNAKLEIINSDIPQRSNLFTWKVF